MSHSLLCCLYPLLGFTSYAQCLTSKVGPAVAGRNASSANPVYYNWRDGHHKDRINNPKIQQQLAHINSKYGPASPTDTKSEQLDETSTSFLRNNNSASGISLSQQSCVRPVLSAYAQGRHAQNLSPAGPHAMHLQIPAVSHYVVLQTSR